MLSTVCWKPFPPCRNMAGGAPMGPPAPRAVAMGGALAPRSGCATGLGAGGPLAQPLTKPSLLSFFSCAGIPLGKGKERGWLSCALRPGLGFLG